jgi:uncharacterized protein (TIGR04255 family)
MRGELLKIEQKQRVKFQTHFLNSVHCQLTISPISAEQILERKVDLISALGFMNFTDPTELGEGSWKFQPPAKPGLPPVLEGESHAVTGLKFTSSSPKIELGISTKSIIYSEFEYSGFDKFSANLFRISNCVSDMLDIQKVSCIGLRKINSMHVGPVNSIHDAVSAFNPSLFGTAKSGIAETQSIKAYEGSLALKKNNYACLIKNRIRNLEEANRFEVVLDFDLLDQNETSMNEDLSAKLDNLNATSFDLFSWAVGDQLTEIMKPLSASE